MTPDAHGYFTCYRCGVLRPLSELRSDDGESFGDATKSPAEVEKERRALAAARRLTKLYQQS